AGGAANPAPGPFKDPVTRRGVPSGYARTASTSALRPRALPRHGRRRPVVARLGKSVWGHVSKAVGPAESLVPLVPTGGWRIYTISGSMPGFDPASWRLEVSGLVQQPVSLTYA